MALIGKSLAYDFADQQLQTVRVSIYLVGQAANCAKNHSCSRGKHLISFHRFMHTDGLLLYCVASQSRKLYHTLPCHSWQNSSLRIKETFRAVC